MTDYIEFVASLSLEEQMKMPLTEADIESYNKLITHFLNHSVAGVDLFPITYSNIKSNAIEFSSRLKATFELESSYLNKTKDSLTLAIPLMKAKNPEIATLLEQNHKELITFLKQHDSNYSDKGLQLSTFENHPALVIDEVKRRMRGLYPEREEVKKFTKSLLSDFINKREIDRTVSESENWKIFVEGLANGKDPYTKDLDDLILASLQKMQDDKAQLEMQMSKTRAIELSNYKKKAKQAEEQAKKDRLSKAIDYVVESCKKHNRED